MRPRPDRTAGPSRSPDRTRAARRALVAGALVLLAPLSTAACVGQTGRNDDYVQPGSTARGPSGQVVPVDDGS